MVSSAVAEVVFLGLDELAVRDRERGSQRDSQCVDLVTEYVYITSTKTLIFLPSLSDRTPKMLLCQKEDKI